MKFAVKNTKTPEQISLEKQINNQVVYIHTRKDKPGHVFYVGEGNAKRPYSKTRNSYWHNIVKKHGYNIHVIKTNLTVEESLALEVKLTLAYKSIGMAEASVQIGGNGNKIVSDETRNKLSISGKNISDETRLKMSIAKQNISDETRLKLGIINKGRKHSDETKKKLSIAKQNMSDETRLKMSIAAKVRIVSDETKLKMSISAKGRGSKPVQAYIGEKIISNFNSAKDAEFVVGIFARNISKVCNGTQQTSGIYDFETKKFVSLTRLELKEYPNCKRVSWRYI